MKSTNTSFPSGSSSSSAGRAVTAAALAGVVVLASTLPALASENAPRKPFAEWADLPAQGQFTVRLWYMEGEGYHLWAGHRQQNITVHNDGEDYGVDPMQGVIAMEYGIAKKWAADVNVGYGTVGTRSFNPTFSSQSTSGLLDTSFGVRYQIFNEADANGGWLPALTFRAGAVLPGSYDKHFPFAPGNHSAAIEPSILLKKHFGWPGFGAYADAYYRWMRTSGDDQYGVAVGFLQEIKSWTLNVGYRHVQQLSGYDLEFDGVGAPLDYSPQVREITDAIDAGFSYTTPKHHIKIGFYARKTIDGSNAINTFALGGYVEIPFGGR